MTAPNKSRWLAYVLKDFNERQAEAKDKACSNKTRYADEYAARAGWIHAMEEDPEIGQLYFYRCDHCRGYHLTRRAKPPYYAVDYLEKEAYK
jgi:hypothetical protein